ncbi:MAG: DUF2157 domain-containing protein [Burkholderiales bacterium]
MNKRRQILEWAEEGQIAPEQLRLALELAGVLPGPMAWRRFLGGLLLWLGVIMIACGLGFFLAYNWNELGRYGKFALAEALVLAALLFLWWKGLESAVGKASLLCAAIAVGVLLARPLGTRLQLSIGYEASGSKQFQSLD